METRQKTARGRLRTNHDYTFRLAASRHASPSDRLGKGHRKSHRIGSGGTRVCRVSLYKSYPAALVKPRLRRSFASASLHMQFPQLDAITYGKVVAYIPQRTREAGDAPDLMRARTGICGVDLKRDDGLVGQRRHGHLRSEERRVGKECRSRG